MAEKKPLIHIEYKFVDGPYGGANQFLRNLKNYFEKEGVYAQTAAEADMIIINHTNISKDTLKIKQNKPELIFIHRVDGPVSKHRPRTKIIDKHSYFLDKMICNGTVFQSEWTKEKCFKLGYKETGLYAIINNAPNPAVFSKELQNKAKAKELGEKVRLISTSWSDNMAKGFDLLKYLDEHLDFDKYEFDFIGKTPIEFRNIKCHAPMKTDDLVEHLIEHDIFIAGSRAESCSNSLIEAIDCGLVPVARRSGCYEEIIAKGGVLFDKLEESTDAIEKAVENIEQYKNSLPYYDLEDIGRKYYDFATSCYSSAKSGKIKGKFVNGIKISVWQLTVLFMKLYNKINDFYERKFESN